MKTEFTKKELVFINKIKRDVEALRYNRKGRDFYRKSIEREFNSQRVRVKDRIFNIFTYFTMLHTDTDLIK